MADWMMLDRFVYRRDDDDGFPNESTAPLRATSSTSLGQAFDLAFLPAEPPAISSIYVRWPGGTTPEDGYGTDVAAAHRDLLLLRLTSIQDLDESPYRRCTQDHFVCVACSDPVPRLQLKRLPVCTIPMMVSLSPPCYDDGDDTVEQTMQQQRVFFPNCVGLARATKYEEEEFAVAQLAMISKIPGTSMFEAEVCVLRSRLSAHDDDGTWEVKKIPIERGSVRDLHKWSMNLAFGFNSADSVITFNHCVCWVNYCIGGILLYEVFEEERPPKISYLRLPTTNRSWATGHPGLLEVNRTVYVTGGDDVLRYITTIRTDGKLYGSIPPDEGFRILADTLRKETGEMCWVQDVASVPCCLLWSRNTSVPLLRNNSLMFPLVSMVDPNIVNFMLSEEMPEGGGRKIRKIFVVTIDLVTKMVNSVVPYIEGDEGLRGKDADMVKEKSHLLKSFLPSEFPKFFNLTRYILVRALTIVYSFIIHFRDNKFKPCR
jgi:hypothetical protein